MERDVSGAHTWLVIWKASDALRERVQQSMADTGLNYTDFAALEMLLHKGPMPVNAIGRRLRLTTGSITTAIDRLAHRGLVERQDDANDKRIRVVHLTDAGRALIEPAYERHAQDLEQIMSPLSADERATLIDLMRRIGRHAEGPA